MGASRRPPKNKEPWQLAENQGSRPGRPSHILLAQTGAARSGSILTRFVCVVEGKLRNDERRWLPDDARVRYAAGWSRCGHIGADVRPGRRTSTSGRSGPRPASFLTKPVMTSHCGCGGLREKMIAGSVSRFLEGRAGSSQALGERRSSPSTVWSLVVERYGWGIVHNVANCAEV
jgi:hypothetical protein